MTTADWAWFGLSGTAIFALIAVLSTSFFALLNRYDRLDAKLEAKFAVLDSRFDGLERRFDGLERRFDGLERKLDEHLGHHVA